MACEKCAPFNGLWMETESGLRRCDCASGRKLAEKPIARPPVITEKQAQFFVEILAALPFFPSERGARLAIGDDIRAICAGVKEGEWLVRRMRQLYQRWPGPSEMRRAYESKYVPLDGIHARGISEVYPDGIPSEDARKDEASQIAGQEMKQIEAGRDSKISADEAVHRAVEIAASINRTTNSGIFSKPATPEEIANAPAWLRKLEGYE